MINLSFQHAHQDEIGDERGPVDVDQAIAAFRAFPWNDQLAEAMKLETCSPSLFLKDTDDSAIFFAGVMLEEPLNFMVYFERTKEVEAWSLFGKRLKQKQVIDDSYGHDHAAAERAIRAFFADRITLTVIIRLGQN